jgi:hypothetical protein
MPDVSCHNGAVSFLSGVAGNHLPCKSAKPARPSAVTSGPSLRACIRHPGALDQAYGPERHRMIAGHLAAGDTKASARSLTEFANGGAQLQVWICCFYLVMY